MDIKHRIKQCESRIKELNHHIEMSRKAIKMHAINIRRNKASAKNQSREIRKFYETEILHDEAHIEAHKKSIEEKKANLKHYRDQLKRLKRGI